MSTQSLFHYESLEFLKHQEQLDNREPRTIAGFAFNHANGDPHNYLGERPKGSFLTDTQNILEATEPLVYPLHVSTDEDGRLKVITKVANGAILDLDEILKTIGQPGINDRIPMVAYGANVCPKALIPKFKLDANEGAGLVPTLYAWMKGYDVVWHEKPSQRGSGMAALYTDHRIADTEIQVALNFDS